MRIPFSKPYITGLEKEYVAAALGQGMLSGDRAWTRRCTETLQKAFHAGRVLLTSSCSAALDMTALLLGLGPGDEAIMPSFNFVSSANAVALRGARPVFADIDPVTLALDLEDVERRITPRTKAIYVVHYAGVSCDMDRLLGIGRHYGVPVIEDAAQAVHAAYKGRQLGTMGDMGCWSFHETKNYTCGEGGALLLNRDGLLERAEILREKGTNRSQFFRGQVDKYTWVDLGSSFLPSDLLAALLCAQVENREENLQKRRSAYDAYQRELAPLAERHGIGLPRVPAYAGTNCHIFYLMLPAGEERDRLMGYLQERGIGACFHYLPLHRSPFGRKYGMGALPVTERASRCILRLPLYCELGEDELAYVLEAVKAYFRGRERRE